MLDNGVILRGIQESITTIQAQTNYIDDKGTARTGELTIGQLKVLIYIMRQGQATGSEIGKDLGMTSPTVSRIVALLSTSVQTRKQLPLGYIEIQYDIADRRIKRAVLTEKGKSLMNVMCAKFNPN